MELAEEFTVIQAEAKVAKAELGAEDRLKELVLEVQAEMLVHLEHLDLAAQRAQIPEAVEAAEATLQLQAEPAELGML